jgi:hypothetical protein
MTRLGAWPTRAEEGRRRRGGSEASRAGAQGTRATGVDRQWQVARRSGVGASPASHPPPPPPPPHPRRALARSLARADKIFRAPDEKDKRRGAARPQSSVARRRRGPFGRRHPRAGGGLSLPRPAADPRRACPWPHARHSIGAGPHLPAQRAPPPSSTSPPPSLRRDATRIHPSPSKSLDRARLFHTAAGRGMMSESDRSAPSEARRRETG